MNPSRAKNSYPLLLAFFLLPLSCRSQSERAESSRPKDIYVADTANKKLVWINLGQTEGFLSYIIPGRGSGAFAGQSYDDVQQQIKKDLAIELSFNGLEVPDQIQDRLNEISRENLFKKYFEDFKYQAEVFHVVYCSDGAKMPKTNSQPTTYADCAALAEANDPSLAQKTSIPVIIPLAKIAQSAGAIQQRLKESISNRINSIGTVLQSYRLSTITKSENIASLKSSLKEEESTLSGMIKTLDEQIGIYDGIIRRSKENIVALNSSLGRSYLARLWPGSSPLSDDAEAAVQAKASGFDAALDSQVANDTTIVFPSKEALLLAIESQQSEISAALQNATTSMERFSLDIADRTVKIEISAIEALFVQMKVQQLLTDRKASYETMYSRISERLNQIESGQAQENVELANTEALLATEIENALAFIELSVRERDLEFEKLNYWFDGIARLCEMAQSSDTMVFQDISRLQQALADLGPANQSLPRLDAVIDLMTLQTQP